MRALIVIALGTSGAAADPPKAEPGKPVVIEIPGTVKKTPSTRTPGMDGANATGRVMVPDEHPDAQEWPNGMVIKPPETGDNNVIIPGTNMLPWWNNRREPPVTKQLFDGFQNGVGQMFQLLVPKSS